MAETGIVVQVERSDLRFGEGELQFEGMLEYFADGWVIGWVWMPSRPEMRIAVELLAAGRPVVAALANQPRADLVSPGRGDGCYGFQARWPADAGGPITARVANSAIQLPGRIESIGAGALAGSVDQILGLTVKGWVWCPANPQRKPSVAARQDGRVIATATADEFRADLLAAGIGEGYHSFVLRLPPFLADGERHSIEITVDDGTVLQGSPVEVHTLAVGPLAILERVADALRGGPRASAENDLALLACHLRQAEQLLPGSLPWRDYAAWRPAFPGGPVDFPQGRFVIPDDAPDLAVLIDEGAAPLAGALGRAAAYFRQSGADILYADAELATPSGPMPWFRPDWSYDLFLAQDYMRGLFIARAELCRRLPPAISLPEAKVRLLEMARQDHIRHLPEVLVSLPNSDGGGQGWPEAIRGHLARRGSMAGVEPLDPTGGRRRIHWPVPAPAPAISLIIPTRDRHDLLAACVGSIRRLTRYPNYEIIVIDNQSRDPETLRYLAEGAAAGLFRIVPYDAPFNFSAMNNDAARLARGSILGFINNDVELITPDWLEQAAGLLARPEVGAVGARLRFANGMIQHAGVILGIGGLAENAFQHLHVDEEGYFHRTQLAGNYSAVTAACLFVRADLFSAIGGFDADNLPVAFNDVDFCLRLRERGHLITWTPHIELYHHESVSRGRDAGPDRQARAYKEEAYMRRRWAEQLMRDPYYNPNLNLDNRPFTGLALPSRHRWGSMA